MNMAMDQPLCHINTYHVFWPTFINLSLGQPLGESTATKDFTLGAADASAQRHWHRLLQLLLVDLGHLRHSAGGLGQSELEQLLLHARGALLPPGYKTRVEDGAMANPMKMDDLGVPLF